MKNVALYQTYVEGADINDRRRFDSYLIGFLLNSVSEETLRAALDAAAADVNGGSR